MLNGEINYTTKLLKLLTTFSCARPKSYTRDNLREVSLETKFSVCASKILVFVLGKAHTMSATLLPFFIQGEVVKGFGRGSKDLGCPTANFSLEVVQNLPKNLEPGVYYGWAQINEGPIYKMVANVGWCPFYQNKQMSVETHIMHDFQSDFYGSNLKISLVGYLRGEKNFSSLDALIEAIKQDIENAKQSLESPDAQKVKSAKYFANKNV